MSKAPTQHLLVRWRDCFTSQGTWKASSEPTDEAVIVNSVGWVVPNYKKHYLVLADAWFERGSELYYGTLTYIPEKMVISKTPLK